MYFLLILCARGRYCASEGLREPSGMCDAGYICYNGRFVRYTFLHFEHLLRAFAYDTTHFIIKFSTSGFQTRISLTIIQYTPGKNDRPP